MGRDDPGIGPGLTTQFHYFRQEISIRQPNSGCAGDEIARYAMRDLSFRPTKRKI